MATAVLAVAGWHYWVVYSSVRSAESQLLASEAVLSEAIRSGSPGELEAVERRLATARADIGRAKTHIRRDPALQLAGQLPVSGPNVEAVERVLTIADNLSAAGEEAVLVARELDTVRAGERDSSQARTAAAVAALDRLGPNIERISELLSASREERLALGDSALLPPLAQAVERIDAELPGLLASIETLRTVQAVAPAMMGFESPRRYLVLALNNGEIMPGGGLVTAAGILPIERGEVGAEIEFEDSTEWLKAWNAQGGGYIEPPGPLKRYLLQAFPWNLAVANWSPDFPTWSRQAAEFYELIRGPQDADGALAIDLEVVERLLQLTGPLTVDAPGEGLVTFTAENAVMELERLTRPRPRVPGDRKSVLGDLTSALLAKVQNLPSSQWPELVETIQDLVAERHLQVMAVDSEEQALLTSLGVTGDLESSPGDYLMVNEASLMGTKLALILEREVEHEIDIAADGSARHTLRYRVRNPLTEWTAGRDEALVDSLMGDGRYGMYLRVFTPLESGDFAAEVNGVPANIEDRGLDSGRLWNGVFAVVPKDTSAEIVLQWTVASPALGDGGYQLYLQQQPGMGELCTLLTARREGSPAEVSVDGQPVDTSAPLCHSKDTRITIE